MRPLKNLNKSLNKKKQEEQKEKPRSLWMYPY